MGIVRVLIYLQVVYKLEANGSCKVFDKAKLQKCLHPALAKSFTFDKFRRLCILCGCDYLDGGIPGVGLKKAVEFFARSSQHDPRKVSGSMSAFTTDPCSLQFLPRGSLNYESAHN